MKFLPLPVYSGGSKVHVFVHEGGWWYLISGLGHKISSQTRNTIESESDKNSHIAFFIFSY